MKEKINIKNVLSIYENEICKNVKNKKNLLIFERHKMENIMEIIDNLNDINYKIKHYNIFLVFEPKERVIMSLGVKDKIINHFVARFCLLEKLDKYLVNRNIATRKNMGTDYGIK